jgi:hypothetical protein
MVYIIILNHWFKCVHFVGSYYIGISESTVQKTYNWAHTLGEQNEFSHVKEDDVSNSHHEPTAKS